ncbi:MAG: carbamoyl phosphate synthase large subunit, partial [Thermodesulfovibrionales bacterium]|nr:carbamoyl phosphate synthase large subunit [Thermodesulfovibrionales bacterium]
PLVSKVCGLNMVTIATELLLGAKLSDFDLKHRAIQHFGVKEAVFPFNMYPEVDPVLGPEMRSTGEVLGLADSFGLSFFKAQDGAGQRLPLEGSVLITVADRDKRAVLGAARNLEGLGFNIKATAGTHEFFEEQGIKSELIYKMHEARPNIVDEIKSKSIDLVINTPSGKQSVHDDSYIRKTAIRYKVPYITTTAAADAAARGISAFRHKSDPLQSLQEYMAGILKGNAANQKSGL